MDKNSGLIGRRKSAPAPGTQHRLSRNELVRKFSAMPFLTNYRRQSNNNLRNKKIGMTNAILSLSIGTIGDASLIARTTLAISKKISQEHGHNMSIAPLLLFGGQPLAKTSSLSPKLAQQLQQRRHSSYHTAEGCRSSFFTSHHPFVSPNNIFIEIFRLIFFC